MGTVGSLFSKNEYLFSYIEKDSLAQVGDYLDQNPELVNQPLTRDSKVLPLCRATWRGNLQMVKLLIDRGASINQVSDLGETATIMAAKRGRLEIMRLLVEKGGDVDYLNPATNLQVIEYALLGGYYQMVFYLYPAIRNKQFKAPQQYHEIAANYRYRYVNYSMVLDAVSKQLPYELVGNYLQKPKKVYKDPVIDPRESWRQWVWRVAEFKQAPLVQRDELPAELQPQNRKMGKIHHMLDSFISRGSKVRPSIQPLQTRTQPDNMQVLSNSDLNRKWSTETKEKRFKVPINDLLPFYPWLIQQQINLFLRKNRDCQLPH